VALQKNKAMKITAYKIIKESTERSLETAVNMLLSAGWQPLGGVAVTSDEVEQYVQAVVKYGD
jgi:hypothetical protein